MLINRELNKQAGRNASLFCFNWTYVIHFMNSDSMEYMMKALVIYDSFFGNTEKIAQAVGRGLGGEMTVAVVKVQDFKEEQLAGIDLLIVGSPTRAFSQSPDIKAFLASIPGGSLKGVKAAAFDTRMDMENVKSGFLKFMGKLFGFADKNIIAGLKRAGCTIIMPSGGFIVMDSEGPLKDGEIERARTWGENLKV